MLLLFMSFHRLSQRAAVRLADLRPALPAVAQDGHGERCWNPDHWILTLMIWLVDTIWLYNRIICAEKWIDDLVGGDWNHGILNDCPIFVGNFIIPTDVRIFFRGVAQPPTSNIAGKSPGNSLMIVRAKINLHLSEISQPCLVTRGQVPIYNTSIPTCISNKIVIHKFDILYIYIYTIGNPGLFTHSNTDVL